MGDYIPYLARVFFRPLIMELVMLVLELIERLKELHRSRGNVEVRFPDWDFMVSCPIESVEVVEKDYMACDDVEHTQDSPPQSQYIMLEKDK